MTHMNSPRFFNRCFPEILPLKTMATALFLGLGFSWPLALHSAKPDQESSEMPAIFRQEEAQPWCTAEDPEAFCFLANLVGKDTNKKRSGRFLMTQAAQNNATLANYFPEDLIVHILSFVSSEDLRAVSCTAKGMHQLIQKHNTLNQRKTLHANLHKWNFDNSGVHFPVPVNHILVRQDNFDICFDYPIDRPGFTHKQQLAYQEAAAAKMSKLLSMPLKDAWPFLPDSLKKDLIPLESGTRECAAELEEAPCFFRTAHRSFSVSIRFSAATLPADYSAEGAALTQATLNGFLRTNRLYFPKTLSVFFPENAHVAPYLAALVSPLRYVHDYPFEIRYFFQASNDANLQENAARASFWHFYNTLAHVLIKNLSLVTEPEEQAALLPLKDPVYGADAAQHIHLVYRNPDGQTSFAKMEQNANISQDSWFLTYRPNRL